MKRRRLVVSPRAERDFNSIVAWYQRSHGVRTAAKVARTLRRAIAAATTIHPAAAARDDLPPGYLRVVAKSHLVVFRIAGNDAIILRIMHGGRDIPGALSAPDD